MAFSSVLVSLTALASSRNTPGKLEYIAALAHWSKNYAVQAYHFTKLIGLLGTTPSNDRLGPNEAEDLVLAEEGLDSYAEMLRQDDQP